MYVIPKMRLNRFVSSPCPSPRRLFQMFGFSKPAFESQTTSDQVIDEVIPIGARKTQVMQLGAEMALKAAEFASNPNSTEPLQRELPKDK